MGDENEDIQDGADDGSGNADDTGQDGSGGDDKGQGQDGDKGNKPDDQIKDGADDDTPPPVRKSATDYYNERQERKAAKQANSQKKDDDGKNEDDDDIDPEDEELISKVVNKKFAPVLEKIASQEEAQEAKDFFESSPEFKPFENKILKWWKDPSRRHLPIATVALEAVGYDNLIKLGAQRERAATEKAKKSNSGGGAPANETGKKGVWEMSPEEFAAEKERVLRRQ